MKRIVALVALLAAPLTLRGQNPDNGVPVLDPATPLADAVSLAEFNADGDDEGWSAAQVDDAEVSGGVWRGTTSGEDPWITLTLPEPVDLTGERHLILEFRMKRSADDTTPLQIFWADDNGGFVEPARRVTIRPERIPDDGGFHVYRLGFYNRIQGNLNALRIDFTTMEGSQAEFDYIRYSTVELNPEYTVVVDPPESARVNAYISLAEFNSPDDSEGWQPNHHVNNPVVAGGVLSGAASGADAILNGPGFNFPTLSGEYNILEVRLKRQEDDPTRIDIFIFDDLTNYHESHKFTIGGAGIPQDGEFHVLQFDATNYFVGTLQNLRIDPTADVPGYKFEIDYIRLGVVAPDADGDGLADLVETNTGTFVDSRDTGTDPNKADTDGDGVNDGVEVAYGTNPNDPSSKPFPSLDSYSTPNPVYAVGLPIAPNAPVFSNGTPTGFSVSPALPAGLSLDPSTGVISGTPSQITPQAVYTITATFANAPADTLELTLAVSSPGLLGYALNPASYKVGQNIPPNFPQLLGPEPESFRISPELPLGLYLDGFTGEIAGYPEEAIPPTDFTVTASYNGYPDSSYVVNIEVRPSPILTVDPVQLINEYVSLGEFDVDDDPEGWGAANASAVIADGVATVTATGNDPIVFRGDLALDMTTDEYSILEFRLRRSDHDQRFQIFWSDDSGGEAEERSFIIQPGDFPPLDGEFHVYQIAWAGVIDTTLYRLRLDDGDSAGRVGEFDYVRIGRIRTGPAPVSVALSAETVGDSAIALRWPASAPANLILQSAPTVSTGPWTSVPTPPFLENNQNVVVEPLSGTRRFYRLVQP